MDKCEQIALAKRIGSLTKMERQTLCHLNTQQKTVCCEHLKAGICCNISRNYLFQKRCNLPRYI